MHIEELWPFGTLGYYSSSPFFICELPRLLRRYSYVSFHCFFHGFQFNALLLLDWLTSKARETSLRHYLTYSWRGYVLVHVFTQDFGLGSKCVICLRVKKSWFTTLWQHLPNCTKEGEAMEYRPYYDVGCVVRSILGLGPSTPK